MAKATNSAPAFDPVMAEPPTVMIAGKRYTFRRLGMRDVFTVSRILGRGVSVLANAGNVNPGTVLQVFVASMADNEDAVLDLLASLLRVTRDELDDPERFPMDAIVEVLTALSRHPDLASFMKRVQDATANLPEPETTTP
jgi:hypothetical protein